MEVSEYRRLPRLVSVSVCYRLESIKLTDDCDVQFTARLKTAWLFKLSRPLDTSNLVLG